MKKKLISIILSSVLIFQIGAIPQISAKRIDNNIDIITQKGSSEDLNSKIIRTLKYIGGTALTCTGLYGLYLTYNYLRSRPVQPDIAAKEERRRVEEARRAAEARRAEEARRAAEEEARRVEEAGRAAELDQRIRHFEGILDRYVANDMLEISPEEINQICDNVKPMLRGESSLLEISGPTIVVGDTHANFGSIEFSIRKFLREVQNGKSILFLGDYVDRGQFAPGGPNSIKNVVLLFKLKIMFPDKVFLLRGNHEDLQVNMTYGFYGECRLKYDNVTIPQRNFSIYAEYEDHKNDNTPGINIYHKINQAFDCLSLAAVVNNDTFCVHGGICPELQNLDQIRSTRKPLSTEEIESNDMLKNLLWSDPSVDVREFAGNRRGTGCTYGSVASSEFLRRNNLRRIVRAHQAVDGHDDVFGDGSVITLFSAPDYSGRRTNTGEIAEINGDAIRYENITYNPAL